MLRIEIDVTKSGLSMDLECGKIETRISLHHAGKQIYFKRGRKYSLFFSESERHIRLHMGKRIWDWHRDYLDKFRRVAADGNLIDAGK